VERLTQHAVTIMQSHRVDMYIGPGGFFWTRFHNLVVFDGENCACTNGIAKQQYISGNSFSTEDLGILGYSSMTVAGESLLSLYKKSYTVQVVK